MTRTATLPNGKTVMVPQCIQRIDSKSTHGWQVRCMGTKFFSGSGDPLQAFENARRELASRLLDKPVMTRLRTAPLPHKTSNLPAGISGPIVRHREGRLPCAEIGVLLPVFGGEPKRTTVYVASQNTYTPERYRAAEAKAITIREKAVKAYERDAKRAARGVGKC